VRNSDSHEIADCRSDKGTTELGAIIGEMPVIGGWFNDRKGCHPGTLKNFLDYISEWVDSLES
jgi:hypothetical protein